jgi:hypothetical protein
VHDVGDESFALCAPRRESAQQRVEGRGEIAHLVVLAHELRAAGRHLLLRLGDRLVAQALDGTDHARRGVKRERERHRHGDEREPYQLAPQNVNRLHRSRRALLHVNHRPRSGRAVHALHSLTDQRAHGLAADEVVGVHRRVQRAPGRQRAELLVDFVRRHRVLGAEEERLHRVQRVEGAIVVQIGDLTRLRGPHADARPPLSSESVQGRAGRVVAGALGDELRGRLRGDEGRAPGVAEDGAIDEAPRQDQQLRHDRGDRHRGEDAQPHRVAAARAGHPARHR